MMIELQVWYNRVNISVLVKAFFIVLLDPITNGSTEFNKVLQSVARSILIAPRRSTATKLRPTWNRSSVHGYHLGDTVGAVSDGT